MVMEAVSTYTDSLLIHSAVDPTRTLTLRNRFARDVNRRFKELIRVLKIGLIQQDALCLLSGSSRTMLMQAEAPGAGAFPFFRSSDKLDAFMRWWDQQVENELLPRDDFYQVGIVLGTVWLSRYLFDAYKRGLIRSRFEMRGKDSRIPNIEETGGIDVLMRTPMHAERLELLYSQVFSNLKGMTTTMSTQMSRVLAQGLADGDNPTLIARKLVAVVNGSGAGDLGVTDTLGRFIPAQRRAEIMARTEVVRVHHQAMIREYMNWDVQGVTILAEWKTAGDHRVCERCEALEGQTFTLEAAMNMIPVHPMCRCLALPFRQEWASLRETIPHGEV